MHDSVVTERNSSSVQERSAVGRFAAVKLPGCQAWSTTKVCANAHATRVKTAGGWSPTSSSRSTPPTATATTSGFGRPLSASERRSESRSTSSACLAQVMNQWADHVASVDPDSAYLRQANLGTPDEEVTHVLDTTAPS